MRKTKAMRPRTRRRLPFPLEPVCSLSAMVPFSFFFPSSCRSVARIAAAERAREADGGVQLPRAQVGGQAALQGDLSLGLHHRQVVGEPRAIALERELV